ncbi:Creatinine amidohydrolase [Candidatus Methanoperedenaceae archaeon GB50]|nr:Creatinine amidohydrolase [Candidatus Methanoperedenaceae archaeon GB50]
MRLEILTMSEFEKTKGRLIIIPFGSIEEHGPHLPLGTDAYHCL